jgi:hypothetical protein
VPARRDYADAWRDSWVTLAQVPVAGLLAADYFYQQWVERSTTYRSHVSARLALARPAATVAGGPPDNVMADVLIEDLVEATRALVRDFLSLPAQTAEYFKRHVEAMINDVLMRIQPDAQTDVRTYVANELDKLNRDLSRLREVAAAETARRALAVPARLTTRPPERDEGAVEKLLADLRTTATMPARPLGQQPGEREAIPRERMLVVIQAVVNAALTHFPAETRQAPPGLDEARRTEERARLLLELQSAQQRLAEAQGDLDDDLQGAARPRRRREAGRTRRTQR